MLTTSAWLLLLALLRKQTATDRCVAAKETACLCLWRLLLLIILREQATAT